MLHKEHEMNEMTDRELYYLQNFINSLTLIVRGYSTQSTVTEFMIDSLQQAQCMVIHEKMDREETAHDARLDEWMRQEDEDEYRRIAEEI